MLVYYNFVLFALLSAKEALLGIHNSALYDAFYNEDETPPVKPLAELVNIVKLVQANKPKDIKDFFTNASCENKSQYIYYMKYSDAEDLFQIQMPSLDNMFAAGMYNCTLAQVYAARLRVILWGERMNYKRVRDITDIMVSISETAELHDSFLNEYGQVTQYDNYQPDLQYNLKYNDQIENTDTKNVCIEIVNRKRAGSDSPPINVQDAANQLKDEIKDWSNKRQHLDAIMMETPFNQLTLVFDEFKKINDGKSLQDTFSEQFHKDGNKLEIYQQLAAIAIDQIGYHSDEIQARLIDNLSYTALVGYTIVMVQAMSKEDREKIKAGYKTKFNIDLYDQLDKIIPECGFEDVILQMMKLYMDDLKKL